MHNSKENTIEEFLFEFFVSFFFKDASGDVIG